MFNNNIPKTKMYYVRVIIFILLFLVSIPNIINNLLNLVVSIRLLNMDLINKSTYDTAVPIISDVILYLLFFYQPKQKNITKVV